MDTQLMKVADEFASFDLLKSSKDRFSPSFSTQETDSMFIITAQLKGYRRRNIKVERNEDGSRITISGEKPIQDMLTIGGKVVKKNTEMQGFCKSFKILQGMVLDKVKIKFNEDDSKLMIQIPKATKGFIGVAIDELKTEEIRSESTKLLQVYTNGESCKQENQEEHIETNYVASKEDDSEEPKSHQRRFKICKPLIFGSTIVISLIVMVFHLVQSEKPKKGKQKIDQN